MGVLGQPDKSAFKIVCGQLGVPVVEGTSFEIHPENNKNCIEMKNIINGYLSTCKTVIIRGTLGEAGMSLYKTQGMIFLKYIKKLQIAAKKLLSLSLF